MKKNIAMMTAAAALFLPACSFAAGNGFEALMAGPAAAFAEMSAIGKDAEVIPAAPVAGEVFSSQAGAKEDGPERYGESGSKYYWNNGTGAGSKYYWKNMTGTGSGYYWKNMTGPGSRYYWNNMTGPGSEYYWKNMTGPGSKYYWNNGTGAGSKYYWKNMTGPGSEYYWNNMTGPGPKETVFLAVCLGLSADGKPLPEICAAHPMSADPQ